jgi:hypothetical protein
MDLGWRPSAPREVGGVIAIYRQLRRLPTSWLGLLPVCRPFGSYLMVARIEMPSAVTSTACAGTYQLWLWHGVVCTLRRFLDLGSRATSSVDPATYSHLGER